MGKDIDGIITDWNKGAERLYGYSATEAIGKPVSLLMPQGRLAEFAEINGKMRNGISVETTRQKKDGTPIQVSLRVSPIIDKEGRVAGASAISRDISELKRQEAALRESEERFRLVADTAPVLIWMAGTDKLCTYLNEPWLEFTGRSIDSELGNGRAEGVHPDDLQRCLDTYTQSFDRREKFRMEYRLRHRDGEYRWILDVGVPRFNKDGSFAGYIGICVDITDRRIAEVKLHHSQQALRTSEERLRLAQKVARIGSFEWNMRTGANIWTPELEAMYGLPPGGFGGTQSAFENLVHPDDLPIVRQLIDKAAKTGCPMECEWRAVWADGSVHWIAGRWQTFADESGEPAQVFGVNIDVTERKSAELGLRETNVALEKQTALLQSREELLKIFVKNVPAAVAMLDRDMHYLQVSDRWCSDYLPGRAQILGRSHYDIFPDMPERWKEVHRRALQGETLRANEDHWDGQRGIHWARWEVRPWKTPEGAVGGILILAEDITSRKQIEEALSKIPRKLIEAQEQERTRIGRELHDDIGQRLALLSVELQLLHENSLILPDVRSRMGEFQHRISDIATDIQSLSHELHSAKLQYLGIAGAMRSFCRELAEQQRVEINFQTHDMPSPVSPDTSLCFFRVLQEALHNAAKHSGVRHFEVRLWGTSNEIHLTISDSGSGFDRQRAKTSQGIGLISMDERVKLVNGTLTIEAQPRRGTTIHARAPLNAGNAGGRVGAA